MQALVLLVCGILLTFDEFSLFWNILFPSHRLFYTHIIRKMRYRARHAISSYRSTEVFATLKLVQSRQFYSNITCITFTSAKNNMFLHFTVLELKTVTLFGIGKDVGCMMLDVGCMILDVGCRM